MGRYLGKCKGMVGEVAVVGVRTRARAALAMATTSSGNTNSSLPAKKIKRSPVASSTTTTTTSFNVYELTSRRRVLSEENSGSSLPPETTSCSSDVVVETTVVETTANCSNGSDVSSHDFPASCCSSNVSSSSCDIVKDRSLELEVVADPEQVESAQTSSRHLGCPSEPRKESKKIKAVESNNLDSPPRLPESKSTVQIKMPSDSELEDFFSSAEKDLQKRFSDKYNFDIVKDVPLEGRYEWVPIKQ